MGIHHRPPRIASFVGRALPPHEREGCGPQQSRRALRRRFLLRLDAHRARCDGAVFVHPLRPWSLASTMAPDPITISSALLLEIFSAFLCDSAVIAVYSTFTAETLRNAEVRRVHTRAPPNYRFTTAKELLKVTCIDSFARLRLELTFPYA